MQEMFQTQNQTFLYTQLLSAQQQKIRLKCFNKIQAHSACVNSQCQIAGLMCMDLLCQCRNAHRKCHHIQLDRILDSINNHQIQIPSNARKTYRVVQQMINRMIEQLSELRVKLDFEQRYFGLQKQELKFLRLVDEQKLEGICGKFVSRLEHTFQLKSSLSIINVEDIQKQLQVKNEQFESFCKYIQKNCMKYDENEQVKRIFRQSQIVKQNNQKETLQKWVSQSINKKKFQSKLLFRASQNNFSAREFHKHCDGLQNTLILVRTEFNKIIGGFTPNKWSSPAYQICVEDDTEKTFLFSLTLKQKFKCIDSKTSIVCNASCGPTFGGNGGHDLLLSDGDVSSCVFPHSYNLLVNNASKYQKNQKSFTIFSGAKNGKKFQVKQYQVYQIKSI